DLTLDLARVGGFEQRRHAPREPALELHELRISPAGITHVLEHQRQVTEIAGLAVAVPQAAEDAEHLDVSLHADHVEPAQELVFAVADVRAQIAEHAAIAL